MNRAGCPNDGDFGWTGERLDYSLRPGWDTEATDRPPRLPLLAW